MKTFLCDLCRQHDPGIPIYGVVNGPNARLVSPNDEAAKSHVCQRCVRSILGQVKPAKPKPPVVNDLNRQILPFPEPVQQF